MTSKCYIEVTIEEFKGGPMKKIAIKATTFRIDPVIKVGLVKLSKLTGQPQNRLANEALGEFVVRRTLEVEDDLESTLEDLRAYRMSDPNFDRAIDKFVEAEATVEHDPAEGRIVRETGSSKSVMRKLLSE